MPVGATFEFQLQKPGRAIVRTADPRGRDGKGEFSTGQSGIKIVLPPEAIVQGVAAQKAGGKPVGGMRVLAMPQSPFSMVQGLSEPRR